MRTTPRRRIRVERHGLAWVARPLIAAAGALTRPPGHRGLWQSCAQLSRLPGMHRSAATATLAEDARIRFPLDDPYWSRLLAPNYEYEPEIWQVLSRLSERRYLFLDCGANRGYWSCLVSSPVFGSQSCVAVEASPRTFAWLQETQRLNGNRFTAMQRAVFVRSEETVHLSSAPTMKEHAGVGIRAVGGGPSDLVKTISVTDLLTEHFRPDHEFALLKLDVEGAEVSALSGAPLDGAIDVVVLYEEHGSDPQHLATRYVLERTSLEVYFLDAAGGVTRVSDADQLTSLKRLSDLGYNMLALSSSSTCKKLLVPDGVGAEG